MIYNLDNYRYREIHSQEQLDQFTAQFPKNTIYRMRINLDEGTYKIKVVKEGTNEISRARNS